MKEQIMVETIYSGQYMGIPAVMLSLSEDYTLSQNELVDKIRSFGLRYVMINGGISANPMIKPLVTGLVSIGYTVIVVCRSSDDIEPLRNIRNVNFIIVVDLPSDKENKLNGKLFPLLKEGDELLFKIDTLATYSKAVTFLKSRLITRPTVCFSLSATETEEEFTKLKDTIINDSKGYIFKVRLLSF